MAYPKLRSIIEDHNARRAALPRREQISDPELTPSTGSFSKEIASQPALTPSG